MTLFDRIILIRRLQSPEFSRLTISSISIKSVFWGFNTTASHVGIGKFHPVFCSTVCRYMLNNYVYLNFFRSKSKKEIASLENGHESKALH